MGLMSGRCSRWSMTESLLTRPLSLSHPGPPRASRSLLFSPQLRVRSCLVPSKVTREVTFDISVALHPYVRPVQSANSDDLDGPGSVPTNPGHQHFLAIHLPIHPDEWTKGMRRDAQLEAILHDACAMRLYHTLPNTLPVRLPTHCSAHVAHM